MNCAPGQASPGPASPAQSRPQVMSPGARRARAAKKTRNIPVPGNNLLAGSAVDRFHVERRSVQTRLRGPSREPAAAKARHRHARIRPRLREARRATVRRRSGRAAPGCSLSMQLRIMALTMTNEQIKTHRPGSWSTRRSAEPPTPPFSAMEKAGPKPSARADARKRYAAASPIRGPRCRWTRSSNAFAQPTHEDHLRSSSDR